MRSNRGSPGALDSPLHKKLSYCSARLGSLFYKIGACSAKLGRCSANSRLVQTQELFNKLGRCFSCFSKTQLLGSKAYLRLCGGLALCQSVCRW
jgi:hypothetical protein